MILKESEIDKETIHDILGKPFKDPKKWFTVTGSCYYFIKELSDNDGNDILIWEDSKGIFQHHKRGLALYVNRSNYQRCSYTFLYHKYISSESNKNRHIKRTDPSI